MPLAPSSEKQIIRQQENKMEGIMEQPFWANGPKPGSFYDFHAGHANKSTTMLPVKHTQYV